MSNNSVPILTPNNSFDYDLLSLAQPFPLQGGSYFTRLLNNNNNLYIKTKPCNLKQGIVQTEHKTYMDLILTPEDVCYTEWFEKLENKLQNIIYSKRKLWFDNDLELEDIENVFTNILRPYKSGKLHLLRCNLGKPNNIYNNVNIYDEREQVISFKDIKEDSRIISILEISGVKFSSRSFNVEVCVKQIMLLENQTPFSKCLIKPENEPSYKESLIVPEEENNQSDDILSEYTDDILSADASDDEEDDKKETNNTELDDIQEKKEEQPEEAVQQSNIEKETEVTEEKPTDRNIVEETTTNELIEEERTSNDVNEDNLGNRVKFQEDAAVDISDSSINVPDNSNTHASSTDGEDLDELLVEIKPDDETVHLKNPNEVYQELYLEARRKAKIAKNQALQAFLEAKKIKSQYLLDEIEDDSDDENIDMFSQNMA